MNIYLILSEWIMKVKLSGCKSSLKSTLISMQILVSDIFEHVWRKCILPQILVTQYVFPQSPKYMSILLILFLAWNNLQDLNYWLLLKAKIFWHHLLVLPQAALLLLCWVQLWAPLHGRFFLSTDIWRWRRTAQYLVITRSAFPVHSEALCHYKEYM